jgi:hypothetical protein
MGENYGVEIYFGEDVNQCPTDIYAYEVTTNVIRIKKALDVLEAALEKYPQGMLAQLGQEKPEGGLHLYLSGKILPTDETGIESVGIENTIDGETFAVLDINSFYDLENTVYHEIFHAMEQKLNEREDTCFDYEVWSALNPEDFQYQYDYQTNAESQDDTYLGEDPYFVDRYSKSFPEEDRARIMEYAMLDSQDFRGRIVEAPHLQAKLSYLCNRIRQGFDTTGWPETTTWEEALVSTEDSAGVTQP